MPFQADTQGYDQVNTTEGYDRTINELPRDLPEARSMPVMVEVTAPATLPEGYSFEATVSGISFDVEVPPGGVEKGQRFSIPMPSSDNIISRASLPVGHWKDDICSCCRFGICHAWLWMTCCCPLVATAQVQNRLHLNFIGGEIPGSTSSVLTGQNIAINLAITIIFIIAIHVSYSNFIQLSAKEMAIKLDDPDVTPDDPRLADIENQRAFAMQTYSMLQFAFFIYCFIVVLRTRRAVRRRYVIPEDFCCEDVACICCCRCCAIAQFGRHTADYEKYRSVCCNATGVPTEHPSIV